MSPPPDRTSWIFGKTMIALAITLIAGMAVLLIVHEVLS